MILPESIISALSSPDDETSLALPESGAQCLHILRQSHHYQTIVCVLNDRKQAESYLQYLHAFGLNDVVYYPTPSLSPYDWSGEEKLSCHQRHHIRYRLLNSDQPPKCILLSYRALTYLMMDNLTWYQACMSFYPGDIIAPLELVQKLIQAGYEPVNWISERGQFTRRGAVLDVYPVGLDHVIRLEWFDDEIEKIFSYQLNDGLNKPQAQTSVTIPPAHEFVIPHDLKQLRIKLTENNRGNFLSLLQQFQYQPELYQIMPLFHGTDTLLDSLPPNSLLLWPDGLWYKSKTYANALDQTVKERGITPVHSGLTQLKSQVTSFTQQHFQSRGEEDIYTLLPGIETQLDAMASSLRRWLKKGQRISIVTPQPQRIQSILEERDCPVSLLQGKQELTADRVWVLKGQLPAGFAYGPLNWFCFTDRELFPQQGRVTQERKQKKRRSPIQLSQMKEGMLVVHDIHGIGRYQGLVQYNTTGETREYLSVHYAGTDRLLVPVEQMHRLQIYHGVGGERVKLHKLGGGEWEKTKAKVKKDLVAVAEALLRTEAERLQATGIAYPEDSEWQREMEAAFPYQETPDQLEAIQAIKTDMEKDIPMNRLVCGDVGFGKTEVALRAIFKAASGGYQVALLAPTTILAHQHYQLLKDRFAPYPMRVELLSRYRSAKESDAIFKELQAGAIDIVVATHRLLSKKLQFHKLGLLVIDEEHRFGVTQKEKLKQLQPNLDILTMSATPIPRTLNIAMGGLKSLSLIETPPPNRQPIKTQVQAFDDKTIQQAIYAELQRGGQIYYIHNRVKDIFEVSRKVQELVPQARIRVAHGQMSKQDLERTMWDFYHHDFDILICTTIVESGLDISNVNTLIIEHVELLGLAQIHQLRGRVGRSNIQAYAYLFYDPVKPLTREARERLTVVQEYSDLGSGYFLALKDMEIRGIGNLIGPQQHGNIVTVGFETYCQLLEETLSQLKGEPAEQRSYTACVIDLNLSAYLPDKWVQDTLEKMRLYRLLAYAAEHEDLKQLQQECESKYGPLPVEAATLWRVSAARMLANQLRIEKIGLNGEYLEVKTQLSEEILQRALRKQPDIKGWKKFAEGFRHPKAPRVMQNLKRIETLLQALEKHMHSESEEWAHAS